jgi:hypothetical protein
MADYTSWTRSGNWNPTDPCEIWYGEQDIIEWYDWDTTPFIELYHEEDYQGIADQLFAEERGYA